MGFVLNLEVGLDKKLHLLAVVAGAHDNGAVQLPAGLGRVGLRAGRDPDFEIVEVVGDFSASAGQFVLEIDGQIRPGMGFTHFVSSRG